MRNIVNNQNTLMLFFLAGVLSFSACRPAKMEPPFAYDALRVDSAVAASEVEEGSALDRLGVQSLWQSTRGKRSDGERVRIAVIGTGVDYMVPDIRNSLWINMGEFGSDHRSNKRDDDANQYTDDVFGFDFYDVDSMPYDWHGHDTYTASIIASAGRTNPEMQGVAPESELMILRYLGSDGKLYDPTFGAVDASDAIHYAADNDARVIYFTWPQGGFDAEGTEMVAAAIKYAKNVVFVTAAGNHSGSKFVKRISTMDNVIVVAALDEANQIASFSSAGREIATVAAPAIPSKGYFMGELRSNAVQSSSVAAAYVAGTAGLLAALPGMGNAKAIKKRILESVDSRSAQSVEVLAGYPMRITQ